MAASSEKGVIRAQALAKHYDAKVAVQDVSLFLQGGEIVGLLGRNGAGKTTLFNVITSAFPPTEGSVQFNGEAIAGLPPHAVTRRGIGRTFQNVRLFGAMTDDTAGAAVFETAAHHVYAVSE